MNSAAPARRRSGSVRIAGIVMLGLGLVGGAWWYLWVPSWRPAVRAGERYGIDVSSHQGSIDWAEVASDGISFAYVKATEGGDFVDARFEENWSGAGRAGLDRGAYHFFTLCTPGEEQAQSFLRIAPPTDDALAPAVDLELAGNCADRPAAGEVGAELDDFVAAVEGAWGRELILYLGSDWEAEYPTSERMDRPLWLRRFLLRPGGDWTIWQLHGRANVEGIAGPVDLDVMR